MNDPSLTPRWKSSEWKIRFLLRYIGTVALLAIIAVFIPYAGMDAIHQKLGLGRLPTEPVVGYLARSVSLFYALLGALLWMVSTNPRRYRPIILFLASAFVVFGILLIGIDFSEGLPEFWRYGEGSIVVILGLAMAIHTLPLPTSE